MANNSIERATHAKANDEKYKVLAMESSAAKLRKSISVKHKISGSWLVHQLTEVCKLQEATPTEHTFIFENSRKAAKKKQNLLNSQTTTWARQ